MYPIIKRLIDILGASIALLLLFPIILLVYILLSFSNRGSALFFQDRPGRYGKVFKVVKFKTMNDLRGDNGELLSDELRLTSLGKFIRKTSLDELPQLSNVLFGNMSLIGPRPLLVEYLDLYNKEQSRRHLVRPGITGWAQVNGRNTISWQKKFEYDIWYVDNLSFMVDMEIVFKTINNVFAAKDINSADSATMEKFKGNQS